MKIHHVDQGTPEWHKLRSGIPTASCFDQIITKSGKPSAQMERYANQLVAERLLGDAVPNEFESQWMNRGKYLEDDAVLYYEMQTDLTTDPGGFVTMDSGEVGCSPDRLVYVTGQHDQPVRGLEIKCPSPIVHMDYVFSDGGASSKYWHQVQGCLWVTKLDRWDVLSYHPLLPPALVSVERDMEWGRKFAALLFDFIDLVESKCKTLRDKGYTFAGDEKA